MHGHCMLQLYRNNTKNMVRMPQVLRNSTKDAEVLECHVKPKQASATASATASLVTAPAGPERPGAKPGSDAGNTDGATSQPDCIQSRHVYGLREHCSGQRVMRAGRRGAPVVLHHSRRSRHSRVCQPQSKGKNAFDQRQPRIGAQCVHRSAHVCVAGLFSPG